MPGRLEYKFLIPTSMLEPLRAQISPHVRPDPFGGQQTSGAYTVRSIYYDTLGFNCYVDKEAGVKIRRKYRIRGYDRPGTDPVVFLEIKQKYAGFIDKHRAPVLLRHLASLLATGDIDRYVIDASSTPDARHSAERFLYNYYRFGLHPAALITYDREAFFADLDTSLRITFDKNLRSALSPSLDDLYDDAHLGAAMRRSFIFELKFFRCALPGWVRSIITRNQLSRMALSKYTICLDMNPSAALSTHGRGRRFARPLDTPMIDWSAHC